MCIVRHRERVHRQGSAAVQRQGHDAGAVAGVAAATRAADAPAKCAKAKPRRRAKQAASSERLAAVAASCIAVASYVRLVVRPAKEAQDAVARAEAIERLKRWREARRARLAGARAGEAASAPGRAQSTTASSANNSAANAKLIHVHKGGNEKAGAARCVHTAATSNGTFKNIRGCRNRKLWIGVNLVAALGRKQPIGYSWRSVWDEG